MGQAPLAAGAGAEAALGGDGAAAGGAGENAPGGSACLSTDRADADPREAGCAGGTGRAEGGATGLPMGMALTGLASGREGGPTAIASTTLPAPGRAGSGDNST